MTVVQKLVSSQGADVLWRLLPVFWGNGQIVCRLIDEPCGSG